MRTTAESAGRDPDAIEITTGAAMSPEERQALVELGVSRMVFPPPAFTPDEIGLAIERTLDFLS